MAKKKKNKKQTTTQNPFGPGYVVGKGFVSEPKYAKTTQKSFAGSLNDMAESLTKAVSRPDCKPDNPADFYYTWVQHLKLVREQAKKYFGIVLQDLPTLTGTDYIRGMIDLVEWCESSAQIVNSGGNNFDVLDDEEETILTELGDNPQKTHKLVEISAATSIKLRTVGEKLKRLENLDLVHRPLGERKGYSITPKGQIHLEQIEQ